MNKFHLILFISTFATFNFTCAQNLNPTPPLDKRVNLELMILPTFFYNSVSLGVSKSISEKVERGINLSSFVILGDGPWYASTALRYNHNITIKTRKRVTIYVPLWASSRFLYYFGSSEQDTPPSQNMFYSVGSGLGTKLAFKNNHKFRIEAGVGASFNTIRNYRTLKSGSNSFMVHYKTPLVPSLRLSIKYVIPLGKRQKK